MYKGKRWYIGFFVQNPITKKMIRKTIKWNRIKDKAERAREGRIMVRVINEKLARGWNPFIEQDAPNSFVKHRCPRALSGSKIHGA